MGRNDLASITIISRVNISLQEVFYFANYLMD